MTLSAIRSIGTLDRTGAVQATLARIDGERFDELDVVRPGDLDACEVEVDVLLVGAKELTATGLRRIARWRRDHPVSIAVAHVNGSAIGKSELAGMGISHSVRGPLTLSKLRNALNRADAALWDLLDAAERHGYPVPADGDGLAAGAAGDDPGDYASYEESVASDEVDVIHGSQDDLAADGEVAIMPAVESVSHMDDAAFAGVIHGVIAEAAVGDTGRQSAAVAVDDWHTPNGHRSFDEAPIVVPAQPTSAHDDLSEEIDARVVAGPDTAVGDEPAGNEPDAEVDAAGGTTTHGDADVAGYGYDEGHSLPEIRDGRIVTIASATGGCGKTFFATSTATVLARRGHRVLLVDLDLQFGEVAAALQVHHPYSIYDGLYRANGQRLEEDEFETHLPDLVCHHELGFDVLAAPRDPVLADYVGARDAGVVLDSVAPYYDVVIVDTPPSLNDVVIAALDRSEVVEVLATPDVPSLRNLTAFTDVLRRLGLEDERLRLVLNKVEPDVGVTVAQANEAFGGRFKTILPADRAVSRAVNRGTTAPAHEPRSKIARAIVPAADAMAKHLALTPRTPTHNGTSTAAPAQPSLRRLWRAISGGKS